MSQQARIVELWKRRSMLHWHALQMPQHLVARSQLSTHYFGKNSLYTAIFSCNM